MLVVNEPELAEAVKRLRGEWADRSAGEMNASATTWSEVSAAKAVDADVIVFPSRYLGELCSRDWLRPVRPAVLKNVNSADFFPLVRNELIKWGGQTMALPLGIEPSATAPADLRSPAFSLLATAAPQVVSNDRLGVLFDPQTMKPRITEPPFVEALTKLDRSFQENSEKDKSARSSVERPLPVLGNGDRLIAVTTASRNAASAFKLIEWLAQPDTSSQFARLDGGMYPARVSLASSPEWYRAELTSDERASITDRFIAGLSGEKCLLIPRIPGIDEYLAALAETVNSTVRDKMPVPAALKKAAQRWEQITEARGRDAQRQAYLKHLGIRDP